MPTVENAREVVQAMKRAGINLVASLPDAALAKLVIELDADNEIVHVPLSREEEGVGVCTGGYFTGKRCALLMQNAGLLNACNGLTTTALQFEIPMVLLVLYAGTRGDMAFPQLGVVTEPVLDALRIPYYILETLDQAPEMIGGAMVQAYNAKRPVAVLMKKAIF